MKQLLIVLFCLSVIYSAQAQTPPDINDRSHSTPPFFPQSGDSSLIRLQHWKDSLGLGKKDIKLINKYNWCIKERNQCIGNRNFFVEQAKWLIEHDEKTRAVESIVNATASNKRADEYDKKARYYLELINKRNKR